MLISSPSLIQQDRLRRCRRRRRPAPQTHVLPMPRATTAACGSCRPRAVRMPAAAIADRVVGVGLPAHQHHSLAAVAPRLGGRRNRTPRDRGTRRGGHSLVSNSRGAERSKCRTSAAPAANRHQVSASSMVIRFSSTSCGRSGTPPRRCACRPGLQHPELAALDGELDIAQVAVVVSSWRITLISCLCEAGSSAWIVERERVADAGDDVLALGVGG